MVQIRTGPKHVRLRSAFDLRWIGAFVIGLAFSIAYYAALIAAGVWLARRLIALVTG